MDSLDLLYDNQAGTTTNTEGTENTKLGALMFALNSIISQQDVKKKSNLTPENVKGLQKLFTLNNYLEVTYGFRIKELDDFAIDKLNTIMSLDSKAFDALIDVVKSLAITLEHTEQQDRDNRGLLRG